MAASTLAYTYAEIRRWVGRQIGASRNPASPAWSADTVLDVGDGIKKGLGDFYWPKLPGNTHDWSFLKPTLAPLVLHGSYATGTVAITTGTVTLTGGTWPSWAASGELWVDGAWYTVATRTDGDTLVLDDSSVTGISGENYTLVQREYDLPDDFGGLKEPFTRRDSYPWYEITTVNEIMIRSMDHAPYYGGYPSAAAIVSVVPTSAQESKNRVIFNCAPDSDLTVYYRYLVHPPMLEGSSYVYPHGGPQFQNAMLLSCLNSVLLMLYDDHSKEAEFEKSLAACIELDKRLNKPETFGFSAYSDGGFADDYGDMRRSALRNANITIVN